ncbi:MAG: energy-coupling factor transporter ATPase [Bacilli bacterium]|nr:energy-coupling factor transporter ATPase [Bacilli bacterium]
MEIKYENVSYVYNPKTALKKVALKDINLVIQDSQINALIGTSGSGKTTLIELLNSLLVPTKGKVIVDKDIIANKGYIKNINQLRRKVGIVFQFPEEQFFNLTVKKEIEFGLLSFNYRTNELDKRVSDALKMVGLDDSYLERDPFKLSNGEQRKVAIASILVFNPKIIVFDEPTIGLDYDSKKNLIKLIRMLKNRYNKTIIIISHDIDFIHNISDYVILLDKGNLILTGSKYDTLANPAVLKEFNIPMPKVVEFSYKVLKKKGIKMGYRDDVNDLLKDIYRYAK